MTKNNITLVRSYIVGGFILDIYKGLKLFKSIRCNSFQDCISAESQIKAQLGLA